MSQTYESISKFLSYILRHKPEAIGIKLDKDGWADVEDLILCANKNGENLTKELIKKVVETSDKKRFALSSDERFIRANQGHSAKEVDISFKELTPPQFLYHGTAVRFVDSIKEKGLIPISRQYVHLSFDEQTALTVGQRHGKPIVLKIKAKEMSESGYKFYLSENDVWLTKNVPSGYIIFS
ncbi:MAG: RNA 2'-phosphotransferase [Campylobacteraceae bacterium]|jgi:putative RNA 2'-phosphotransferase|nr:RNA 2'-phosphotransferase [Campylobacteraceae bacterium]